MFSRFISIKSFFYIIFLILIIVIYSVYLGSYDITAFGSDYAEEFCWPLKKSYPITSYFGYRDSPVAGGSTYHSGLDIGAPERYSYSCLYFW